eukprot:TRINITY_DN4488_c0_g1_i1.p1 TRINITY_DN4488_c0_g1~~TRINITY_DN4488_c0_g1_i1.p1  ORF type:complete len:299 (-),score=26.41 TRINITY_DN4488_c0_g1_i1:330-1187(-)
MEQHVREMESEGFRLVTKKAKKRSTAQCSSSEKRVFGYRETERFNHSFEPSQEVIKEQAINQLQTAKSELKGSTFYTSLLKDIKSGLEAQISTAQFASEMEDLDVVCYGIGNISRSKCSLYQLALISLLLVDLEIKGERYIFDPVLTNIEQSICQSALNMNIIPHDEIGKRRVERRTLFFMPHCDKALYQNLLIANYKSLNDVIIIGNSFAQYQQRCVTKKQVAELSVLLKVAEFTIEIPFSDSFSPQTNAFNDLSLHYFDPSSTTVADLERMIHSIHLLLVTSC